MAHTPGPWTVARFTRRLDGYDPIESLYVVRYFDEVGFEEDGGGVDDVCEVMTGYAGSVPDENARLISAAPDLLAAARRAARFLSGEDGQETDAHAVLGTLWAAIAKATTELPLCDRLEEPTIELDSVK